MGITLPSIHCKTARSQIQSLHGLAHRQIGIARVGTELDNTFGPKQVHRQVSEWNMTDPTKGRHHTWLQKYDGMFFQTKAITHHQFSPALRRALAGRPV